ncbi:hypothetical protein MKW94_020433 [Papaver nudicaule]|uniref:Glycosyltransferase n=1 Tax=Papaver nudicaule TaxID=74823 RepID=A0AA41RWK8_PAPNU|nr:hypothetical protein [Papaver nudicaule]
MDHEHQVVVVVVPLPAQGHLNQLLHFSRLVSDRQIPVHYVGAATHNRQAKSRVHGWDPLATSNIHFHDFSIPSFPTPPPDTSASNKWPSHLIPMFEATVNLREPLAELLRLLSLTSRRVVVVHDNVMSFAAKEATLLPNGEAYAFNFCSAFGVMFSKWEALGRPSFPGIESLNQDLLQSSSFADCLTYDFLNCMTKLMEFSDLHVGEIYNTCYPIEGKFIDLVSQEPFLKAGNKQWAFGPLNPISVNSKSVHRCLEWLDKKPLNSVLYVSFGTTTSISDDEIRAIAIGLEKSEQKFIWVLRQADLGDVYANQDREIQVKLPEGYEERVKGVGMIVRDWAPQLEILAHSSTGGFLTHCGWNSCMESLSMGVPMAAWPMHSDQPRNTMLITEILKVGVVAREWGNRNEVASPTEIEDAIRKLMVSDDGKDTRKRAEELGVAIRESASKEGKSTAEFNSFVAHISRA